jgi:hypothetical protein
MVTGRGPALGQHLRQGGLGLLHAAGQPVGQDQQPAGPQTRPALLLGDVGQCLPGESGRLLGVASGGKLGAQQRDGRRHPRHHAPSVGTPGWSGRGCGSKARSACSSRRSTASKALTPATLPTAHHVTQSDC